MGSIVATAAILLVCVLLNEACNHCVPMEGCLILKKITVCKNNEVYCDVTMIHSPVGTHGQPDSWSEEERVPIMYWPPKAYFAQQNNIPPKADIPIAAVAPSGNNVPTEICVPMDQCLIRKNVNVCQYNQVCCEVLIESSFSEEEAPSNIPFKANIPPTVLVPTAPQNNTSIEDGIPTTYWPPKAFPQNNVSIEALTPKDFEPKTNDDGDDKQPKPGQYPWVVAIIYKGVYWAGGSLIHPKVVLTAAHITLNIVANETVVRAGEFDMNSTNEPFQHEERNVERFLRHEGFVYETGANDLALIFVKTSFELKDHIGVISLPNPQTSFEGRRCTAVGWEKESSQQRNFAGIMRQVELPIVDRATCEDQFKKTKMGRNFHLAQSLICAGGERDRDICFGSGGSALFCPLGGDTPHAYVQVGIVVWGMECGINDIPGTYTNVATFKSWIDQRLIFVG
ncbi:phenoloxidase-activating factor 2 isoform X2 [Drosophila yakuba]|uniref:Phenoloxidase-activating factor 2 n=1 Tax=Drosophila yakuba TaxID=7245 RepID=B4P8R8_DROYA|nr:phenoloxidase-activating factor 2 isoform X2 [Drosophila yakuba]EDW90176.2 uncharacterized protein Dyak_GE13134, isoform A [Drosophila yakuba]